MGVKVGNCSGRRSGSRTASLNLTENVKRVSATLRIAEQIRLTASGFGHSLLVHLLGAVDTSCSHSPLSHITTLCTRHHTRAHTYTAKQHSKSNTGGSNTANSNRTSGGNPQEYVRVVTSQACLSTTVCISTSHSSPFHERVCLIERNIIQEIAHSLVAHLLA